jgi:hypothetical protein
MSQGLLGGESRRVRGNGSRGGAGQVWMPGTTVAAKRSASKPNNIRKKMDEGVPRKDLPERGYVRLGKTATDILIGEEDISEWDNEEIRRGRKRDQNGGWRGREPVVVPMALHQEAIKRTFEEAQEVLREGVLPAVKVLRDIIESEEAEDKDKLKAVQMILDRVLGKPVERVEINTEPEPWEEAVVAAVVPLAAIETKEVG